MIVSNFTTMRWDVKMRRQVTSFEELVLENKKQLLNDPVALEKIDERIDERKSKETTNQQEPK